MLSKKDCSLVPSAIPLDQLPSAARSIISSALTKSLHTDTHPRASESAKSVSKQLLFLRIHRDSESPELDYDTFRKFKKAVAYKILWYRAGSQGCCETRGEQVLFLGIVEPPQVGIRKVYPRNSDVPRKAVILPACRARSFETNKNPKAFEGLRGSWREVKGPTGLDDATPRLIIDA